MVLVMLTSPVPGLAVPVHAFGTTATTASNALTCYHDHFGSNHLCDCLFCTADCNYDCGVRFGNTPYRCGECRKCADCMEDTHCSTCGLCSCDSGNAGNTGSGDDRTDKR